MYETKSQRPLPRTRFARRLALHLLLGGMGPVNVPATPAGKLFAGCYALYAGLVFVVTAALVLTPVVHRVLHTFHADQRL
jgi:hypothetical protein